METRQLIAALGGIAVVAAATSAKPKAISAWGLPGRGIPHKHKPAIARLAAERAIDLPTGYWAA